MPERERIKIGEHVTIFERGKNRLWCADFWQNGDHRRRSLKTRNKKIAMERAMKLNLELSQGTYSKPIPLVKYEECVDQYIAYLETENRSRRTTVKYRGIYKVYVEFLGTLGVQFINHVCVTHFDRYRSYRKANGAKKKTRYTEGVVIKQLHRWAKSRGLISDNPIEHVKLEKPRLEPRSGPTLQQINLILEAVSPQDRIAMATLAFTGMRSGELQRLQLGDVDLEGNWISIVSRTGLETKTRTSRRVPIHPRLRTELEKLSRQRRTWVFTNPNSKAQETDSMLNVKKLNERFLAIAGKLQMPVGRAAYGFTLHSLRHSFETIAINARIPQRVVDAWLGHTGDRSMGAVYYRLSDEESQSFMTEMPF